MTSARQSPTRTPALRGPACRCHAFCQRREGGREQAGQPRSRPRHGRRDQQGAHLRRQRHAVPGHAGHPQRQAGGEAGRRGLQSGVATANPGNLARFRVKRDGKDEYVEGEAERIEHDAKTEITKFFNRAWVKSGDDEVRGQYIVYDGLRRTTRHQRPGGHGPARARQPRARRDPAEEQAPGSRDRARAAGAPADWRPIFRIPDIGSA
jgi:hypothetical protein